MGRIKHRHWRLNRARRGSLECGRLLSCSRPTLSFFCTLILLFGALLPSWHQAKASVTASSELAQLQLLVGDNAEALAASICHHEDGDTSQKHGQDEPPFHKKSCPLCLTLAHQSPALTSNSPAFPVAVAVASTTFLPARTELKAGRQDFGQGRPRAPPLAA